jgi:hypothetical protein
VRPEAAQAENGEATRREQAEPKTHDRIVGGAASTQVQPE